MNQEVNVEVTQEVQNQLDSFIQDLESAIDRDIEEHDIPSPPEDRSNPKKVKDWLQSVDEVLEQSSNISGNVKKLQPYAKGLLAMLGV